MTNTEVAPMSFSGGGEAPPSDDDVARPYLTSTETRVRALRPEPLAAPVELAEPPPLPAPPRLPMHVSEPETLLVTAPVDGRGRIRLDDAVRELGWLAGQHLTCATSGGVATLRRDTGGAIVLGADRRATLAEAAWYALGVRRGQRAAVVTDHDRDEVRVFSVVRLVEVVL